MKTDRLIGIITTIQQKKKVTAQYLAEKFEVSERTIRRDIETICQSGIPLVTHAGKGGGISLMEGFSIDTTVFTKQELAAIFTGLRSLDSVSYTQTAGKLAEKLGGEMDVLSLDCMEIDLASFYKPSLAEKIETLRRAIREKRRISFRYYYPKGEEMKIIEPQTVMYRWSDWYIYGYAPEREDFRMYKLRRLWELTITEEGFEPHEPPEKREFGSNMTDDYIITAIYQPAAKYRLVEEYGPDSFTEQPDGTLLTNWGYTSTDYAVRWFLSFGDDVEVIAPAEFVEKMRHITKKISEKYE